MALYLEVELEDTGSTSIQGRRFGNELENFALVSRALRQRQ